MKILEHCHASKGKKVWLDADIFAKHNIAIPEKLTYLLGDACGPKSTYTVCLSATDLRVLPANITSRIYFQQLHAYFCLHMTYQVVSISHSPYIRPTLQLWPLGLPISSQ
jgi:hypothetical protein